MNWAFLGLGILFLAYCATWLHEHGWLRSVITGIAASWQKMPRGQAAVLLLLLLWAIRVGGTKPEAPQGGQQDGQTPNAGIVATNVVQDRQGPGQGVATTNSTATASSNQVDVSSNSVQAVATSNQVAVTTNAVPELQVSNQVFVVEDPFQRLFSGMEENTALWQTYAGPVWPFDDFTSNAIAGMAATTYPPIPDAMLASGLALYRVTTNTVLFPADTNSMPVWAWLRHGADNRGVAVDAPFPVTVGTNIYSRIGILANCRLAFGYATYQRQPTGDLPFATSYPIVTVAPLWGPFSLVPSAGSAAWTRAVSTNSFVVCWEKLLVDGDPARPATVQCEIRRDGVIRFLYGSLADGAAAAGTVGVQNLGQGWTYSHGNTNRIMEGLTVTLRPVGLDGWADADPDGDGLSSFDEFLLGTEPRLADTDADGPSDYWEVTHGFDPLVAQLAPPDPDTDGDLVPDRWEVWLNTPTNNPALGQQDYLDPDDDGFTSWYEVHVLGSNPSSAVSPGAPDANHTDVIAEIDSSRPCVLRLAGGGQTIEIPWMPGLSPARLRLRLTRGQQYLATLSRVPASTTFTTEGFWWASLAFEAAPDLPDLALPPVIANGTNTYFVGTVCIQTADRAGDYWLVPGAAASPTNRVDAWRINIPSPNATFCHTSTNATLQLTGDSLYAGTIEWLGLPPVEVRTGNPLVFDPSTVTPGHYTITARSARNPLVTAQTEVDINYVALTQNTIWLSADDTTPYSLPLSGDTYSATGLEIWSDPEGWIDSTTFTPAYLDPGAYTVYVSDGACGQAQMTVNIVQARLIPDFNHDRVINVSDETTNMFHFWINDDAESGDITEDPQEDVPGHSGFWHGDIWTPANYTHDHVCGHRDLLDYFPLWLDLSLAFSCLPPGQNVEYRLRQADSCLKVVFTDLTIDNAGSFLTEDASTYGPDGDQHAYEAGNSLISSSGLVLPSGFLNRIANEPSKGLLMVEGVAASSAPLVLELRQNGQTVFSVSMPLKTSTIGQMYRWINLRHCTGGSETDATNTNEPPNYPDILCNGKQFVYTHGFLAPEDLARAGASQLFKRLYQSGSRAMFTMVCWQGDVGWISGLDATYYHQDVVNALGVASNYCTAVSCLPGEICVAAHSLGNMLVSSAVADYGLTSTNYFMFDAAVALEAYNGTATNIVDMVPTDWTPTYERRLWSSDWWSLFPGDGRYGLTWQNRFGNIPRAINYFSSTENVLANNPGGEGWNPLINWITPSWMNSESVQDRIWVFQERTKGYTFWGAVDSHVHGGWNQNPCYSGLSTNDANALSNSVLQTNSFFQLFFPTDLYTTNGSALVSNRAIRSVLLAEAVPAVSCAAGWTSLDVPTQSFGLGNVDMMTKKTPGATWPRQNGDWWHGDFKEVAYFYVYGLFDDVVDEGALR